MTALLDITTGAGLRGALLDFGATMAALGMAVAADGLLRLAGVR